jgi:nucleoside-diphosphate-sugar epimerase
VLITGANGNLGRKATATLVADGIEVAGIDREADEARGVRAADLTVFDSEWAAAFTGVDAVLHLAADPRPVATWQRVIDLNIDLSLNVLRAAEEARVRRFVFASSNWVLGGYRFTKERLTPATPPRPVNPYGASKLVVERIGLGAAARTGMSFLALRIGWCQPGENRPGPDMWMGRWGQQLWLSNEDWAQAVRRSCMSPFTGSAVLNVMSDNAAMRWDLSDTLEVLGYAPLSRSTPRTTMTTRLHDLGARARDSLFPRMAAAPLIGERW